MRLFRNIFRHKSSASQKGERTVFPLRIESVGQAPMTPEPDEAEIAAQAILELMADKKATASGKSRHHDMPTSQHADKATSTTHDADYYQSLAERIRKARTEQRQRATRFVAYCEEQLRNPDLPLHGSGSLTLIETELYKRIDVVEREGGTLKSRWQHCLAEVTVRLMGYYDVKL